MLSAAAAFVPILPLSSELRDKAKRKPEPVDQALTLRQNGHLLQRGNLSQFGETVDIVKGQM